MTDERPSSQRSGRFPTTRWSLVIRAAEGDTERAQEALARLCEAYWRPLYSFARRTGEREEDAKDVVQGFFADFLGRTHLLGSVSHSSGRFRSYLLGAFAHYRLNLRRHEQTMRSGAGIEHVPIEVDFEDGERRYRKELATRLDPLRLYERQWALTFLDRVLGRLKERYDILDLARVYEALAPYIPKDETPSYDALSVQLRMTVNSLKVALHRVRTRYQEMLREEAADLISDPGEVEEEIRYLLKALSTS
jgi:DNA-directed RNA polymerase specialized sigma24 family protein